MEPISSHTGRAMPLRYSNVDTDQIIPAVYLKRISRTGFEDGLFAAWRSDPEFVLNDPRYDGASILVAGSDFGTGSSREHAVWALMDYGFRVVISSRFADIFRGNASKSGLVTAELDQKHVEQLWSDLDTDPAMEVRVDVVARTVTWQGHSVEFTLDDYTRWRLIEGLDDIDLSLRHAEEIDRFEAGRAGWRPITA